MGEVLRSRDFWLVVYLISVNIYGFSVMGIDKWKAKNRSGRIAERKLFLTAFLGGSAGIFAGMRIFHHKTLHDKFKYGIPALLILNIAAIVWLFRIV